jgi:hypothetical protein
MSETGREASTGQEFAAIVCPPDKLEELLSSTTAMGLAKVVKASGGPISATGCRVTGSREDFRCEDMAY